MLKLRVTQEENRHVKDVAKALGVTVSNYVRRLIFGSEPGLIAGQEHHVVQDTALRSRLAREREQSLQSGQTDEK
jgi:hypothetical protein